MVARDRHNGRFCQRGIQLCPDFWEAWPAAFGTGRRRHRQYSCQYVHVFGYGCGNHLSPQIPAISSFRTLVAQRLAAFSRAVETGPADWRDDGLGRWRVWRCRNAHGVNRHCLGRGACHCASGCKRDVHGADGPCAGRDGACGHWLWPTRPFADPPCRLDQLRHGNRVHGGYGRVDVAVARITDCAIH